MGRCADTFIIISTFLFWFYIQLNLQQYVLEDYKDLITLQRPDIT